MHAALLTLLLTAGVPEASSHPAGQTAEDVEGWCNYTNDTAPAGSQFHCGQTSRRRTDSRRACCYGTYRPAHYYRSYNYRLVHDYPWHRSPLGLIGRGCTPIVHPNWEFLLTKPFGSGE